MSAASRWPAKDRSTAVIRRDLGVLSLLGAGSSAVGPTANPIELIKALGAAGENRNVTFDIGIDQWGSIQTLVLKAVEIA